MSGKFKSPGTKVFIVLTITVLVIVSSISINVYRNRNPKVIEIVAENNQGSVVKVNNNLRGVYSDLDDDGMLSWEKVLNSTEPRSSISEDLDFDFNIETNPDSFTSGVGIEAMQEILTAISNPNGDVDIDALMEKIGKSSDKVLTHNEPYNIKQLFIVESSEENIKNYINNLTVISEEEFRKEIPDVDSFMAIPTEKDFIVILSRANKNIAARLSSISVPEIFANVHIEYSNSLDAASFYTAIMLDEMNDPLLAYMATPKLTENLADVEKLFTQIMNYPVNNGIIFNEDDPAYAFYNEQ